MQPIRPGTLPCAAVVLFACAMPGAARAADSAPAAAPAPLWAMPFLGLLLSIALLPMVAPRLWHRRMGIVVLFWTLLLLLPQAALQGPAVAATALWHAVLLEYLPFVTLLFALFTVGGGILLRGGPWGRPAGNTLLLGIGTLLAGVMGTTGAAMVLIHPLLRANAHRVRRQHLAMFFIMLVANVGGATTPLGDPPLFIGFLRGVPFFWPAVHLAAPAALVAGLLLAVFYLLDRRQARTEPPPPPLGPLRLRGWRNVALLGAVIATVLAMGVWQPPSVAVLGQHIGPERLIGMAVLTGIALVSLAATPRAIRADNMFTWSPMAEVAKLFLAIFVTIGPVIAMLHAGFGGPLGPLLLAISDPQGHPRPLPLFWLAGSLAAFLDNAPTYLIFFELTGADPAALTGPLAPVLRALSAGAVFFGGLTYIGNAPNMMVRSIAAHRGVRMPGFFGYMVWSCGLLLPAFVAVSLLFFV